MANACKIFVCSAGFGEGHHTAARNLCTALNEVGAGAVDSEFVDVLGSCHPRTYQWMRSTYVGLMNRAPWVWSAMYRRFDKGSADGVLRFLRAEVAEFERRIIEDRPIAVISTYPLYGYMLDDIARRRGPLGFLRVTLVTDSISINSIWHRCGSDYYCVPNEDTAEVMRRAGVAEKKLRVLGFPVNPRFADPAMSEMRPDPAGADGPRVLYMINAGRRAAPETVRRLLALDVALTVTVGRDEAMRATVEQLVAQRGKRSRPVHIIGWTKEVPELLASHHLIISKAGGATTQEAIAARCPMIVSQIAPGQEEGNAQLLVQNRAGALGLTPDRIAHLVEEAFADGAKIYREWSQNIARISRPGAARENARFILEQAR